MSIRQVNATTDAANTIARANGEYHVVITNSQGLSVSSTPTTVTVNPPPVITEHPISQTAVTGANITFSVTATGESLSYQWQKNNSNIAEATAATLTLTNVTEDNNSTYRCVVTNPSGATISNEAILGVRLPNNLGEFTNGLVAFYPFDGNASDLSGNGHHGTLQGPTLSTDRAGHWNSSYIFDGIDDHLMVTESAKITNFNYSTPITFTTDSA